MCALHAAVTSCYDRHLTAVMIFEPTAIITVDFFPGWQFEAGRAALIRYFFKRNESSLQAFLLTGEAFFMGHFFSGYRSAFVYCTVRPSGGCLNVLMVLLFLLSISFG